MERKHGTQEEKKYNNDEERREEKEKVASEEDENERDEDRRSKLHIRVKINAYYCIYEGFVEFQKGWIWR